MFFSPKITLPTRIQPPSATLIDNILSNDIQENCTLKSGILINDISDHKMIFVFKENNKYTDKINKFVEIRTNDLLSINAFNEELKSVNIYSKLNKHLDSSPQDNYEIFSHLLDCAREKHLPLKRVKFNKKKLRNLNGLQMKFLNRLILKINYIKFLSKQIWMMKFYITV